MMLFGSPVRVTEMVRRLVLLFPCECTAVMMGTIDDVSDTASRYPCATHSKEDR